MRTQSSWHGRVASGRTPRFVVTYQGEPVTSVKAGLRHGVARANRNLPKAQQLVYGVTNAGATFHTIRHTMATLLAEWGGPDAIRQMVMGHGSAATTQKYTIWPRPRNEGR